MAAHIWTFRSHHTFFAKKSELFKLLHNNIQLTDWNIEGVADNQLDLKYIFSSSQNEQKLPRLRNVNRLHKRFCKLLILSTMIKTEAIKSSISAQCAILHSGSSHSRQWYNPFSGLANSFTKEVQKAWTKDYRRFNFHNSRECSWLSAKEGVMCMLLLSSDPFVYAHRFQHKIFSN